MINDTAWVYTASAGAGTIVAGIILQMIVAWRSGRKFHKHLNQQLRRWSNVCLNCGRQASDQARHCVRCGSAKLSKKRRHSRLVDFVR